MLFFNTVQGKIVNKIRCHLQNDINFIYVYVLLYNIDKKILNVNVHIFIGTCAVSSFLLHEEINY